MTNSRQASEIGIEIAPALEGLVNAIESARSSIFKLGAVTTGVLYCSKTGTEIDGDPAELLAAAISDIDCHDNAENGAVSRYPGVFEVSPEVISACLQLNLAKEHLEACVKSLEAQGVTARSMRTAYKHAGRKRIHPLQAWRELRILEGTPASIGFTQVKKGEGTVILSRDEVIAKLLERGEQERIIVEELRGMPESARLSWHTPVSPHVRANLVWGAGDNAIRRQVPASMPFLVAFGSWPTKRVRFNIPREHKTREDQRGEVLHELPFREGAYLKSV